MKLTLSLLLPLAVLVAQSTAAERNPNITIIPADDTGWSDLGGQEAAKDLKTRTFSWRPRCRQ